MAERNHSGLGLPWGAEQGFGQGAWQGESRRFYLVLALMAVVFLPPALLIPALNLPERERNKAEEIPPQLARLIEERDSPEPAPIFEPEPEPAPVPEPEPEVQKPEPLKEPPAEVAKVQKPPESESPQTVEKARAKASRSGLLAMKDTFASMRSPEPETRESFSANVDANAVMSARDSASPNTAEALSGSGGIALEQGMTQEVTVAGHDVRQVNVAAETEAAPEPQQVANVGPSTRSMKNIKQVFDANKTSLTAMVGREQRKDPLLHGKILLKLVIEPDGSVSSCEVVESELDHSRLEQRIAMRVRLFNFGQANVERRELNFPLDFLPG